MADAPQLAPALRNGIGRNCFGSDARVEQETYTCAVASAVVPWSLEERAGEKRTGEECTWQQLIPAAKRSWRASAKACVRRLLRWRRKLLRGRSLSRWRIHWSAFSRSAKPT